MQRLQSQSESMQFQALLMQTITLQSSSRICKKNSMETRNFPLLKRPGLVAITSLLVCSVNYPIEKTMQVNNYLPEWRLVR